MSRAELSEEVVFDIARRIEDAATRRDYVDQACESDPALKSRINELLKLHDEEASFLESPPQGLPPTVEVNQITEKIGQTIGRYTLREQIGEGGMGVVFVAEQEKPLRRKVALKVIKPGMDSNAVLARFDAERNALALMNHPNIAKVLDAGTTDQGHPYFVMELIQGKTITEYCDEKRLTINQRLELFSKICNAVQHAHQKGVVHRDIKPSNILVTEIDGKPVPKVIDFGVAKALGANLTDRTIYTSFQALVGTPLYMSPEQTQLSGVDVDTSSDVYSMGILLYELLTGTTPLSPEELRQAAQDEILRRIRETEPPRPSNRISSLGETSTRVSECRGTGPADLGRLVRGDLDWIVMKALEKDRNRRYKTADAFAADVGRHLANEPVEARPPTVAYRMAKFVRRNRAAVVVVSLTFAFLCAGLTFYRREAQVQQQLRDAAIAAEQAALQREKEANEILAELQDEQKLRATTLAMSGRRAEATRVARQLVRDPSQRAWEPFIVGHLEFFDGNIEEAFQRFAEACRSDREFLAARMMLALTYLYRGLAEPYREELEEANKMSADGLVNELYAIQANMYDRSQTLETIDKIEQFLAEQPYSPVARLVRAEVMLHKGLQYSDMNAIDQAIHDSRIALEEIPGNPMATFLKMTAHGFAVRLCRQKGWTDEIPEHIREGEAAARQLEPLNWAAGHRYRALFYGNCALGFAKEAQAWEQAQKCGLRGFLMDDYLTFHFQYGTTPTVDRELDPSTEPYAVLAECLLSASDPQMRRDSIRRIRTKLISPGEPVDFYVAAVLALLGHDVHAYASQGFGFTNHRASVPKETSLVLNEYFRGRINEKQMIEACASQGIVETGFVRLCAGLRLIGERKVERAMQLLDKVASESGDQWSSIHANAILTRLREARDWPYLGDDVREPTIDRKATSR